MQLEVKYSRATHGENPEVLVVLKDHSQNDYTYRVFKRTYTNQGDDVVISKK